MSYDETEWLQEWEAQQLAAQQAEIDARLGGAKFEPVNPALQAILDVQTLQDAQFDTARTAPIAPPNVYNISDPATRLTESELEREWIGNKAFNQPRVSSPFAMGPSGMQSRGRNAGADAASYAAYLAAQKAAGPPISQRTPPTTTRGGSGRLTTQQQAAKTAESVKETSATAQQAIADAYAAIEAAKTGNTAANVIANMSADDQMRMILAQNANAEAAAASEALRLANENARLGQGNVDEALLAALAAGGDLGIGGPAGVAGDSAAIADTALTTAAEAVASGDPFAAADAAGTDIRGRDLSYLQDPELNLDFLTAWDTAIKETLGDTSGMTAVEAAEAYETASAQRALDAEIINQEVFDALEVQIATDEGGNINAPIFEWGVNAETGADQIVMAPTTVDPAEQCALDGGTWNGTSCDLGDGERKTAEQLCIDQGGTWDGTSCKIGGETQVTVPAEEELTYEQKQKDISTNTYNDRIKYIQAAVKAGQIDLDTAQTEFNTAKNQLFAQMAALNEATYGTVEDEFQARTTQRGTDVADMLALLAEQGVEQNLIQDVIGGDIGMNLAGYGEETDAMRDFMGALELIGQQGASEAEMLGNYMFDSYRQDLDTTGRNMELQAAMQMLAEQQTAAEQNLQSSMLGPYFGIDPALMMAGMGAGVDVAGVSENRAVREQAAEDAMAMLLAQQAFQTGEREAGQRFQTGERLGAEQFAGGQSYQDNVWDYLTGQTMTPYQSGMLGVAEQGQQMDTLSTLWDIMNPQPTTAQTTAMAAQAQTDALDSALSKMRVGNIPAQSPSPANNFMGGAGFNWKNNLTGEEIQALDAVGWDTEGLLYGDMQEQVNSMNEISNMGSFADVMQVPLEVLMGAQALGAGVVGALVDDIIAGGNDPLVNYTHPAMEGFEPWTESIPLSQATALYDYEYQAGEPTPFNLFGYDVGEEGLLDTDRVMDLMELGYTMEEIEEALLGL